MTELKLPVLSFSYFRNMGNTLFSKQWKETVDYETGWILYIDMWHVWELTHHILPNQGTNLVVLLI
jgi:hypothetical protein